LRCASKGGGGISTRGIKVYEQHYWGEDPVGLKIKKDLTGKSGKTVRNALSVWEDRGPIGGAVTKS